MLTGVVLAGTLSVLDSTIVVPLLTTIGADLGGGSAVSWLVAAYLLASTVTIPLWGRWLDLRGEKVPMFCALALFALGTALCAAAPSLPLLIIARVVQGVGAGGVVPLGQAIIAGRCDTSERAQLQIYYNVAYGIAAGLGPLLGGALVGVSWRWAFIAILPFCLVVAATLRGQLSSEPRSAQVRPFDAAGSALVTVGLTALLLAVERKVWWLSIVGLLALGWFALRVRTHPHGLIPRSILGNRVVMAAAFLGLLIGFIQFSYLTYLPALSQQQDPELNSGLVVIPLTVLWMTLGAVTGVLALRVGTRRLVLIAAACATAAGALVALSAALPGLFVAAMLVGTAAGLSLIPLLLLAQLNSPSEDMGSATSTFVLLRNFGGALGVAVTAVLLLDTGRSTTFWMLALVGLAVLVPAATLPSHAREAEQRAARAHG